MTMHSLTKSAIFFARRPHRPGQGHAAHRRHPRPDAKAIRCSAGGWWSAWWRSPACRRFGIFMSEFLVVTSTFARQPLLALPLVVGLLVGFGALLLRLHGLAFGEPRGGMRAGQGVLRADVRSSRAGAGRGRLPAGAAGRLVPERGGAARMRMMPGTPHCPTCSPPRDRSPRIAPGRAAVVPEAGWRAARRASGGRRAGAARPLGRARRRCTWRCSTSARGEHRRASASTCPSGTLSVGRRASSAGASGWSARSTTCSASRRVGAPDDRPWLDHGRWGVRHPLAAHAAAAPAAAAPTSSCRSKARACIRFRSGRCMPASSSRAISASPRTARRWCAWRSGSATSTRASRR